MTSVQLIETLMLRRGAGSGNATLRGYEPGSNEEVVVGAGPAAVR
jgi:hypothetical protein